MLIAARSSLRTSARHTAATGLALEVCDRRAHRVPHDVAASGVERADGVAAFFFVAIRVVMRIAARARFRSSALWIRARFLAGRVDVRLARAERVPLRRAAEQVDEAHCVAALRVVAPRSQVHFTAGSRALAAALRLVALATLGRVNQLDACRVPFVGAAVLVDLAHRLAALGITAGWARVRNVAAWQAFATALRKIVRAEFARANGAVFVPTDDAAILELFRGADARAAFAARASRQWVRVEAVAAHRKTAAAEAGATRFKHARRIPAHIAAIRLETAHRFAATRVITEGSLVRHEAVARADVTATGRAAAGHASDRCAARVPTFRAAGGINVAHTRAADFILAARGFRMRIHATSAARAWPRVVRHAESARGLRATRAPTYIAAHGIGLANNRAAGRVFATRA